MPGPHVSWADTKAVHSLTVNCLILHIKLFEQDSRNVNIINVLY